MLTFQIRCSYYAVIITACKPIFVYLHSFALQLINLNEGTFYSYRR